MSACVAFFAVCRERDATLGIIKYAICRFNKVFFYTGLNFNGALKRGYRRARKIKGALSSTLGALFVDIFSMPKLAEGNCHGDREGDFPWRLPTWEITSLCAIKSSLAR